MLGLVQGMRSHPEVCSGSAAEEVHREVVNSTVPDEGCKWWKIQKFKRGFQGKLHHLQMQVVTCTFFASA
jgi:hypothetical protein